MLKFLLFLSILPIIFANDNYFCNFHCKTNHTVCRRKHCLVSPACGPGAKPLPLDDNNRAWVLDLHNQLRNKVASGDDTRGGNSRAGNMRALSYDKEIEFVAQCWANACRETGQAHDACRSTKKFEGVGQNMYYTGSTGEIDYTENKWLTDAVNSWYSEISQTTPFDINSFKKTNVMKIGHFTQIVWAETTHIGCGRVFFMSEGFKSVNIYCNYGPTGNMPGRPVYQRAEKCSKCGSLSCNKNYTGLCGEIEPIQHWNSPFIRSSASSNHSSLYTIIILIIFFCFA